MRLKIVQVGEPPLRRPAQAVEPAALRGEEMQRLIADMRDTLRDAPGVGLAAPQVGVELQLAVIEDRAEYHRSFDAAELAARGRVPVPFHVIANPRLEPLPGDPVEFYEGCLSLAGFSALVPRARAVRVKCLDADGQPRTIEAEGWYARILQHEIDHLQARLYIDRMRAESFTTLDNWARYHKSRA